MTTASTTTRGVTLIEALVVIVIIAILIALMIPSVECARPAALRAQCRNNLKQIGLAMHNYHEEFGSFPPAFVADEDGNAMHSWRVLLLPYMEQTPLYEQYNFDEPWDGPNNSLLHDAMINAYSCPSQPHDNTQSGMTNYVAIVGPTTVFPADQSTAKDDITDGTSNTLLVVEMIDSGIHWMEPRDLDVQPMLAVINPGEQRSPGISSNHRGGAQVVLGDGSVRFLSDDLSATTLRAMWTIAGGEAIDQDF